MLDKLIPADLPDVAAELTQKPVRRSLAILPDPEPLPDSLVNPKVETAKAVAEHSGFGQSQAAPTKKRTGEAVRTAHTTPDVPDTGRMLRRSKQTELMSTRVQPDTLRFLRDYANANDMTFAKVVETVVSEFRKSRGL